MLWLVFGQAYLNLEYQQLLPHYPQFLTAAFAVPLGLLMLCWWLLRTTPGKAMCSLLIVDADSSQPPTPLQFAKRFFGYCITCVSLGLGFLWAFIDDNQQAWHDKFASTRVMGPKPKESAAARKRDSAILLPLLVAIANVAVGALVFYSPIGEGNGSGVIGYSIYRGLLLLFLHLPLGIFGLVISATIGFATSFSRAVPGIILNLVALAAIILAYAG